MNKRAFFFMDDMLLLPVDLPDPQTGELPIELAEDFNNPEIFEIQALETGSTEASSRISIVSVMREAALPKNWMGIPVRHALTIIKSNTGKMFRAFHIARWRKESRFCGSCGSKNLELSDIAQRTCPACGRIEFPRICPAVITVITNDDGGKILLAHNKNFRTGLYSHISGFYEAGESIEETVVREIYEEINISVKDIVYIKSQPWPFPNSLMLGFKAHYLSGTIKPDGIEIEDARWFTRNNLPELPAEGSLSRFLINCWLDGSLES